MDSRRLDLLLGGFSAPDCPLLTTTITSPPYGDLKDYGHHNQIGRGQADDEYRIDMRRIFRSLYSHTRDDGSLWLVADTLRPRRENGQLWQLRLLPFELAREAEDAGWLLRDVVIWKKNKTLPWSSPGRLRNEFEYVLFFVKSKRFQYHVDRLREPVNLARWWVKYPERYNPEGKAPTNVWEIPIPVQGSWANTTIQHACPLPPDLVERLVLLSTNEGDVVCDPFAGSGVVIAEAERLKRRGVGTELVERYIRAFRTTVRPEVTTRRGFDVLQARFEQQAQLRDTILRLRVIKYARVLMDRLAKIDPDLTRPKLAVVIRLPGRAAASNAAAVRVRTVLFVEEDEPTRRELLSAAITQSRRKPLSMFGVAGDIAVAEMSGLSALMRGRTMFAYTNGRTWQTIGRIRRPEVPSLLAETAGDRMSPIISNVFVNETPRPVRGDAELGTPTEASDSDR